MKDTRSDFPRRVCILVLPAFSNLTLAAVMEPLRVANRVAGRVLFEWLVVTHDGAPVASSSGLRAMADAPLATVERIDALFVVASFDVQRHTTMRIKSMVRSAARAGIPVGGMESAAYVLAAAGVLDGCRATTHWEDLGDLEERFPKVQVVPDRFVIDRNRMTSGGALATLDLMLELLRRDHGAGFALRVSGILIYEPGHARYAPQERLAAEQLDPVLVRATRLMERNLEHPLAVAAIAASVDLSARELLRRFRSRLGRSPRAHYADLRLTAGRRMLEHTDHELAAIAVACGFGSGSAFARAFRRRFGTAPSEFRRAHGVDA